MDTLAESSIDLTRVDDGESGVVGPQGPPGADGAPGADGQDGADGHSPVVTATRTGDTVTIKVDGVTIATVQDGTDGQNGTPGAAGANGQTSYLHIAYATNATGTAGFSTTDSAGKTYIGQYTDFVQADSTTPSKYSWTLIKGDTGPAGADGQDGATGRAVSVVYRYYLLQGSTLTPPVSTGLAYPPPLPWSLTEPTYTSGSTNTLYTVDYTLFSDGSGVYSAVSKSSSYEAAKEAYNKAVNAEDSAIENIQNALETMSELDVSLNQTIWTVGENGNSISDLNYLNQQLSENVEQLANDINKEIVKNDWATLTAEPAIILGKKVFPWKLKITSSSINLVYQGNVVGTFKRDEESDITNPETELKSSNVKAERIKFRDAGSNCKLSIVAQTNGHISLKEA